MADYSIFPKINATLNGSSAVLLVTGRVLIARGKMAAHRAVMLTALGTSSLFLVSYLYYHYHVGSVHFRGTGWTRPETRLALSLQGVGVNRLSPSPPDSSHIFSTGDTDSGSPNSAIVSISKEPAVMSGKSVNKVILVGN